MGLGNLICYCLESGRIYSMILILFSNSINSYRSTRFHSHRFVQVCCCGLVIGRGWVQRRPDTLSQAESLWPAVGQAGYGAWAGVSPEVARYRYR